MIKRILTVTAMAGTAVVAFAGTAVAAPCYHAPEVKWVSSARVHGDSATLTAKYRCSGGDVGTHLWVSLKQGGGIKGPPDQLAEQEGTSAMAKAWYDAHPGEDPGTKGVHCNGRWQTQSFTIHREPANPDNPSHPAAWEELVSGKAFLQFCLYDSTATGDENSTQGFGYKYTYVGVKV